VISSFFLSKFHDKSNPRTSAEIKFVLARVHNIETFVAMKNSSRKKVQEVKKLMVVLFYIMTHQ
jgi:hypothetical protein